MMIPSWLQQTAHQDSWKIWIPHIYGRLYMRDWVAPLLIWAANQQNSCPLLPFHTLYHVYIVLTPFRGSAAHHWAFSFTHFQTLILGRWAWQLCAHKLVKRKEHHPHHTQTAAFRSCLHPLLYTHTKQADIIKCTRRSIRSTLLFTTISSSFFWIRTRDFATGH